MRAEGLHRDLNLLILAVTFGMAYMTVYNGPSFNAFVRSLGGGDFIFAAMMAMPVFTGLLQLVASVALRRAGRRRKLFIIAGLLQRLILIPSRWCRCCCPNGIKVSGCCWCWCSSPPMPAPRRS